MTHTSDNEVECDVMMSSITFLYMSYCIYVSSKTLMSVPPDKTTAQRTKHALTRTVVSSVSVWTAPKSLMLHMSRRRQCEHPESFSLFLHPNQIFTSRYK